MAWYKILARVCKAVGQYRLIPDREGKNPYMHRYYLLSTRWLAPIFPSLSYRLVLHNPVQSDEDGLHDHPWKWYSKILAGGYWEYTPEGKFWRGPNGWRKRTATDFHRLVLDPDKAPETWTLFIMGPKEKEWGFLSKDGTWVQWEEYINNRHLYT